MSKITLNPLTSGWNATTLNTNLQKIEDALNNEVLYRDNPTGEPNALAGDIDMNSQRLYNLPAPLTPNEAARLADVQAAVSGAKAANLVTFSPSGGMVSTNVQSAIIEAWNKFSTYASSIGSSLIGYIANGAGASSRTVQAKLRDYISVKDFGAVGDGVTDDYPAIMAAINSLTIANGFYPGGPSVYFPPGTYYCSQTINLKKTIRLFGDGSGMQSGGTATLKFAANIPGIVVNRYDTLGAALESPGTTGGDASIIEGLRLFGGNSGTGAHGIWLRARALIRNCYIIEFGGNGIHIYADTSGTTLTLGNANCFHIENVVCILNKGHGIYVKGGDANAGNIFGVDSSNNGGCGIWDSSFLGNTYQGCHTASNGWRGAGVHYSGNQYMCVDPTNAGTTYPGTDSNIWYLMQTGGVTAQYTDFVYNGTYQPGCSYKSDNANARNIFTGCYSEGGQGPANIRTPAFIIGGLHGSGVMNGAPYYDAALGFAYLRNAPLSVDQGYYFGPSLVTRSPDTNTLDAYKEGSFTPTATNLTVVGTPSYYCNYTRVGNLVHFNIVISVSGGTTASTANSTYLTLPITPSNRSVCHVADGAVSDLGNGFVDTTGRVYLPTWSARATAVYVSGTYNISTTAV